MISIRMFSLVFRRSVVTPAGFEPATYRLEVSCSIQLSYGAKTTKTHSTSAVDVCRGVVCARSAIVDGVMAGETLRGSPHPDGGAPMDAGGDGR